MVLDIFCSELSFLSLFAFNQTDLIRWAAVLPLYSYWFKICIALLSGLSVNRPPQLLVLLCELTRLTPHPEFADLDERKSEHWSDMCCVKLAFNFCFCFHL